MPPSAKPTENPAATRGKCAFIWRTSSSRPACAADQHEADRDRQREQHEQGERDPHAVPRGEHQPARRDDHQVDPEHACRKAGEGDPALGAGQRRGDRDPDRRDREVDVGKAPAPYSSRKSALTGTTRKAIIRPNPTVCPPSRRSLVLTGPGAARASRAGGGRAR